MIYRKIILILLLLLGVTLPSFAEKIAVKIAPTQLVTTKNDKIEVGDWINFEIANDVYVNDALYLKKNTRIVGVVDFVHQNGWGGDAADITFKNFYTVDAQGKKVNISYPLDINGNSEFANSSRDVPVKFVNRFAEYFSILTFQGLNYAGYIFRGAEISVEPDTKTYNIFINR